MNCDQFQSRMDSLLDMRCDVSKDELLGRHAQTCSACAERLCVWGRISEVVLMEAEPVNRSVRRFSPNASRSKNKVVYVGVVAVAAAVVLFVSIGRWRFPNSAQPRVASAIDWDAHWDAPSDAGDGQENLVSAAPQARLLWQSEGWWTTMPDEQWVHYTMPGVDTVRQGVAPIGRSMKQAIAILMIQTQPSAVNTSPVSTEVTPEPYSEQTSRGTAQHPFATLA